MSISYGHLLILSFLFLIAINCGIVYLCSSRALKVMKEKSTSEGITKIRIYDKYILTNLTIVNSAIYVFLSYLYFGGVFKESDYLLTVALVSGFVFVLLTTFFSRLCYCYACNVLLKTSLNEYDVFKENFFYLIRLFLPLFTISFVLSTISLFDIQSKISRLLSIGFIIVYFIIWTLMSPVKSMVSLGAKPLPKDEMYDFIENVFKENKIKKYKLYYWDSSRSNEANAIVGGFFTHYLFISTTLMQILDRRELEAALLHEIGHIKYKHFLKIFIFRTSALLLVSILFYLYSITLHVNVYILMGFVFIFFLIMGISLKGSKKYEDQADLFVNKKGFGKELISALKKASFDETSMGKLDEFFSTHPNIENRIEHLNDDKN